MSHTVTAKLNKAARQHPNQSGVTFFVSLGEKNYNFQTKQNEWTNYDAALFAKDGQIQFYAESLVEGAIISVSGTGLIMEAQTDPQYKPKLMIQDAKLGFVNSPQGAPAQQGGFAPQQAAPQQQGGFSPQQQAPTQQGGYQHQAPAQHTTAQQGGFAPQNGYPNDKTPPY